MTITRPVFANGNILGAADLTALGAIDRGRAARHARHCHTPGIGAGLSITAIDRSTTGVGGGAGVPYQDLTLEPGYAVDGTGRELVVGEPIPLSSERFFAANPNPPDDAAADPPGQSVWHPVFLRGADVAVTDSSGALGCQGSSGPTGVNEDVEIRFGAPGDELSDQPVPSPDAGAGDGGWQVLVGFVRVNRAIGRFTAVATSTDGSTITAVGVRAETVTGPTGRVESRAGGQATAGTPATVVDTTDGGRFAFGLHTGAGTVDPLFTVDASGNLWVKGTLSGRQQAGSVRVASGVASDGVVLPLPAGVDQQSVDDGATVLSIVVSPRAPDPGSAPNAGDRFVSAVCRVDADRRVECWGSWFSPSGAFTDASSACDYLVLATVPEGGA